MLGASLTLEGTLALTGSLNGLPESSSNGLAELDDWLEEAAAAVVLLDDWSEDCLECPLKKDSPDSIILPAEDCLE